MGKANQDMTLTCQQNLNDLEHGKPTCQLEKVLTVLRTLGVNLIFKVKDHVQNS